MKISLRRNAVHMPTKFFIATSRHMNFWTAIAMPKATLEPTFADQT